MDGYSKDEIYSIAKKVYDVLPYEKYQSMYDSVMEEYNEEENIFPENAITKLLDGLADLLKTNPLAVEASSELSELNFQQDEGSILDINTIIYINHGEPIADEFTDGEGDEIIDDIPEEDYEPPKAAITEDEMDLIQDEYIHSISDLFKIDPEVAEVLYKKYYFDIEKVKLIYASDSHKALEEIGLTIDQARLPIHLKKVQYDNKSNIECQVCFDDQENGAVMYSLPCGHAFCRDCWQQHIKYQISKGNIEITCQNEGCKNHITMRDVRKFSTDSIFQNYTHFLIRQMVQQNKSYVACIRPNCPHILTKNALGLCHVATCICGFRMCWKCKQEAHAPLECTLLSKWFDITKEEFLENKWIAENTKPCPHCNKRIEKNGGCNHMTCRKEAGGCGYEFCWICGHEWVSHKGDGYSCNKYTDFDNHTFDNKGYKFDMKRLLHYQSHYLNQKKNKENEQKNRLIVKSRLIDYFENYVNPAERLEAPVALELADNIFAAIDTSRSVLIWSYPHAFFMKIGSNELSMFEYVQQIVEEAIENLTFNVENLSNAGSPDDFRSYLIKLVANTNSLNKHVDKYSIYKQ